MLELPYRTVIVSGAPPAPSVMTTGDSRKVKFVVGRSES